MGNVDNALYKDVEAERVAFENWQAKQRVKVYLAEHSKPIYVTKPKPYANGQYIGQCTEFVKTYLGVSGSIGDGGRKLSINSGPVKNAVVVFKYTHVAVITGNNNGTLTLAESNLKGDGKVTLGRQIAANDPSIAYFHHF